uniref:leucine-rich repeat protein n=1 Tax=uncultured Duncaniella sp. TaxID=2768039 RepID=UPI0025B74176
FKLLIQLFFMVFLIPNSRNVFHEAYLEKVIIPETVQVIGEDSLPACDIELRSPYFTIEDGILMTSDKKRIIRKLKYERAIYNIPEEVCHIDKNAFSWYGEVAAPYFFRVPNPYINHFDTISAKLIISNAIAKTQLQKSGFSEEDIIVGNVFEDKMGVVYSADKKTLLCYPRELPYSVYEILSECENIAQFAFVGYEDPDDDGSVFLYGNSLKALMLPKHLKNIGSYSLTGLYYLKVIILNRNEENRVKDLLAKNEHWHTKRVLEKATYVPIYYPSNK